MAATTASLSHRPVDVHQSNITIENILSIWPTLNSLSRALSAGDLISLSRTSRSIRAILHAFEAASTPLLQLGHHETPQWALIKSVALFTCISPTHKDPKSISSSPDHSRKSQHPIRPCNFCSRPICRTCIVRSFFADPTQSRNTYKHRTRHLCTTCWDTGNLRKDYRYPLHVSTSSREHIWRGQNYALRGQRCTCSASEDNWLCHPCRVLQNEGGPPNVSFFDVTSSTGNSKGKSKAETNELSTSPASEIPCYGLDCTNTISLADSGRDRRRICLWCSRPLPRPFGGEDRRNWEKNQINIRNANAASRSADIAEWARNRFRSLTVTRQDLRGLSSGSSDDQTLFVKHLDAVNYRILVGEVAAPSPDDVYNSKNGQWRYNLAFLSHRAFWQRRQILVGTVQQYINNELQPPISTTSEQLFVMTSDGALPHARRNKEMPSSSYALYRSAVSSWNEASKVASIRLAVQFLNAGLMTEQECMNLMAGMYEVRRERHWDEIHMRMYNQLMACEAAADGEAATRDTTMPTTFGEIIEDKGVILNTKKDEKTTADVELGQALPGPSMTAVDNEEAESDEDPLEETSQREEPAWDPDLPPPGSPPSFAAALNISTPST